MYVDFDRIPAEDIPDIPDNDPRWIGAWWLGFIICGLLWICVSFLMMFYPKKLSGSINDEESKADDVSDETSDKSNNRPNMPKQILQHIVGLLKGMLKIISTFTES